MLRLGVGCLLKTAESSAEGLGNGDCSRSSSWILRTDLGVADGFAITGTGVLARLAKSYPGLASALLGPAMTSAWIVAGNTQTSVGGTVPSTLTSDGGTALSILTSIGGKWDHQPHHQLVALCIVFLLAKEAHHGSAVGWPGPDATPGCCAALSLSETSLHTACRQRQRRWGQVSGVPVEKENYSRISRTSTNKATPLSTTLSAFFRSCGFAFYSFSQMLPAMTVKLNLIIILIMT